MDKRKKSPRIGLVTIGQSPREDIMADMKRILPPDVRIMERGALDDLTRHEIEKLAPGRDEFPLITRLRDGSSVVVGKKKILPLLKARIAALESQGVNLSVLLCTGDFPDLESRRLLLVPSRILFFSVVSILRKGKVGVLVPLSEQKQKITARWQKTGLEVAVEVASPYGTPSDMEKASRIIKGQNVDLVVLDCLGYSLEMKRAVEDFTEKPVLLPRSILARFIWELAS